MAEQITLVVGLGNPGPKYAGTRHNIGFMVLDRLADTHGGSWKEQFRGQACQLEIKGIRCSFLKPMTYMNLSGESVGEFARYYKVDPASILVVYDELDFPFGRLKLRLGGSAGGHNGIKSLIQHLGTQNFPRVRLGIAGIDRAAIRGYTADYVLAPFTGEENKTLPDFVALGAEAVVSCIDIGFQKAMNEYNKEV